MMMTLTTTPKKPKQTATKATNEPAIEQDHTEFVKEQVLQKLGTPKNLFQITAGNMWANRWRVNVWLTHKWQGDVSEVDTHLIDHSYFIHTAEDGTITKSSPEIEKEH